MCIINKVIKIGTDGLLLSYKMTSRKNVFLCVIKVTSLSWKFNCKVKHLSHYAACYSNFFIPYLLG